MSDALTEWLQPRATGVPESLAHRIAAVVKDLPPTGNVVEAIKLAADRLVARAVDPSTVGNATELLAADALITYMCEAVSELDPGRLMDLS